MTEIQARETIFSKPSRVDREKGIFHGVKLLGSKSAHGRDYSDPALEDAARLYEGARINVDHPRAGDRNPRSVRDRGGIARNVKAVPGDGVFGDVFWNPERPDFKEIAWWAENDPAAVGFSPNHLIAGHTKGGRFFVESVRSVVSIDLVGDPATTRGLFEGRGPEDPPDKEEPNVKEITLESLKRERPDLVKALVSEHKTSADELARISGLEEEKRSLQEELDRHKATEALAAKRSKAVALCESAKLPKEATSETFLASLLRCAADEAMEALVKDRQALVLEANKPTSTEGKSTTFATTEGKKAEDIGVDDLVAAVKRR